MSNCNEQSEISLIKGLAAVGVEAVITDAGWFEGGWPAGAGGNYQPNKEHFPNGMGPVAKAAKENNMIYGLWFEPDKVFTSGDYAADIAKTHPEYVLRIKGEHRGLLNFGVEGAREYFLSILDSYFKLPGFSVYRQDFNFDPKDYWLQNDANDRQGITEMKYVEGLYEYWDQIAQRHPESFREECAAGGKRIDLETIKRFHTHQKSDLWLNNNFNVASNFSLSRFLPNVCFQTFVVKTDDYSFHLSLPSSMCVSGWAADEKDFPVERAKQLTAKYFEVKHLLIGDWYPLTNYGDKGWEKDAKDGGWLGSQYNRPEIGEGLILVYKRSQNSPNTLMIRPINLEPKRRYLLKFDTTSEERNFTGAEFMNGITIKLDNAPSSEMIIYKKIK